MNLANLSLILGNAPLVQIKEDTMLPSVPSQEQSESFFLEFVSYVQQWGVLFCIVAALLCFIVSKLFKVKKNPKSQRIWRFYSFGFVFIAIIFAFLPYIALRFY
jgi:predicted membrane channel-forming protein YqfA (hemolysin III family)